MLLIGPLVEPRDEERDLPLNVSFRSPVLEDTLEEGEDWMFDLFVTDQTESNWIRFRDEMLAGFAAGDEEFKSKIRQNLDAYALSYSVRDLAKPFRKPSLIVTGRQDGLESYPRCTFAVLDMAGHAMQIERDRLFGALVHDWLDRLLGGCRGGATPS